MIIYAFERKVKCFFKLYSSLFIIDKDTIKKLYNNLRGKH